MSSFSDAHELVEIPIIAANLHRLMLPRQSQIWAVLHRGGYACGAWLTAWRRRFWGACVFPAKSRNWARSNGNWCAEAQRLYALAAPIIKRGTSRRFGEWGESWRHPRGWQAVVRVGGGRQRRRWWCCHAFEDAPDAADVPLPPGSWRIDEQFPDSIADVAEGAVRWSPPGDFSACVLLLSRSIGDMTN